MPFNLEMRVPPHSANRPITELNEDEILFRDTVRQFAEKEIAPLVRRMDEEQHFDAGLIRSLFELGLMGIEIPEQYGGSGGTFFDAVLAVETISAVDPAVGVLVDVQNTLVINALLRWATRRAEAALSAAAGDGDGRRLRAERSGFGLRCVRAADAGGKARRQLHPERPQAVDHECQ